jgi:hypothetical protein
MQRKVERGANLPLHLPVEIDEDVAARDEIDARNGGSSRRLCLAISTMSHSRVTR